MTRRFIGIPAMAEYLGVSSKTIRAWVWLKQIPYFKLGRLVRFDLQSIDSWIKERRIDEIS
jgi:excisionase family DNA binding protein